MSKKNVNNENYLDKIPVRNPEFGFSTDEKGFVTLEKENKGITNRIFQKFFKKPKISYIHLDEMGSFLWNKFDDKKTVFDLGKDVEEHFGEKAQPIYERLVEFLAIMESYKFITLRRCSPPL